MKRKIRVVRKEGCSVDLKELPISKATMIKTTKEMIHLDKMDDGTWRIIWSEDTLGDDLSKIQSFDIVREE